MNVNFILLLVLFMPNSTFAESPPLCPKRVIGPNEPEELLMHESDFSLKKANESINFLKNDFSKRIWGPKYVKNFSAWSGHYISYMNSLRLIEGALLKKEAQRLRAFSEQLSSKSPDSSEAKAAIKKYKDAQHNFCHFINNSIYVD